MLVFFDYNIKWQKNIVEKWQLWRSFKSFDAETELPESCNKN
jgi:hypothetical protein